MAPGRTDVTAISSELPPAITFETTAGIVQRHSDHTDSVVEPTWTARSKAHCRLMAPMSNDRRIQYLGTAGCDDDTVRFITRATAESIGKEAKPDLRSKVWPRSSLRKHPTQLLWRGIRP